MGRVSGAAWRASICSALAGGAFGPAAAPTFDCPAAPLPCPCRAAAGTVSGAALMGGPLCVWLSKTRFWPMPMRQHLIRPAAPSRHLARWRSSARSRRRGGISAVRVVLRWGAWRAVRVRSAMNGDRTHTNALAMCGAVHRAGDLRGRIAGLLRWAGAGSGSINNRVGEGHISGTCGGRETPVSGAWYKRGASRGVYCVGVALKACGASVEL